MNNLANNIKRVWDNNCSVEENSHRVVIFRKHFYLDQNIDKAELFIAADTDFIACLDGIEIDRGQFPDDPTVKTFNRIKLPNLAAGEHLLAVKVYFCGIDTSGYAPGEPGLYCILLHEGREISLPEKWYTQPDPSFQTDCRDAVTKQLGFTVGYDLRKAINWASPELDDNNWQEAMEFACNPARSLQERPVGTHPNLQDFYPAKLIKTGNFQRKSSNQTASAALLMAQDICYAEDTVPENLPASFQTAFGYDSSGIWLIADLGEEMVGFIEFELDAPDGARVDCGHGEHLADGRVRTEIYGRNFADICICSDGRNVFHLPFRRIGGRFLELHISNINGQTVTLHRIGIRPWVLSLPPAAECNVSNKAWQTLYNRSVRTLELCMHEHYEDCPWREQALYTYDSRWQMLYGYYLWGNGEFAAASLDLFVPGQREDGHLRLCAPCRSKTVIPVYSLMWIVQVYEHYLYTGSNKLFIRNQATAAKIIKMRLDNYDSSTALYHSGSPDFWHFYEWAEGLCSRKIPAGELHSLYNLYFVEALEAYAKLLDSINDSTAGDYRKKADELRKNIEKIFYNPEQGLYASTYSNGKQGELFHQQTQVMMLYTKSVPEAVRPELWKKINGCRELIPMTLSSLPYLVLAVREDAKNAVDNLEKILLNVYQPMLESDTNTLWESGEGENAFQFAGSLCHGWSALPAYYLTAVVLGVRPLTPGFKKFSVNPHPGSIQNASGEVVTPYGKIYINLHQCNEKIYLQIKHPKSLVLEKNIADKAKKISVQVERY